MSRFWLLGDSSFRACVGAEHAQAWREGLGRVANTSSGGAHGACGWVFDACRIFVFRFFVWNPLRFGSGSVEYVVVRFWCRFSIFKSSGP